MMTKRKFASLTAILIVAASFSAGCGFGGPKLSEADQQKIAALDVALKNGILTQQEHDAKLKEIYTAAAGSKSSPANASSAADAQKLQALENACSAGALTPDECAQKRAALTGVSPPGSMPTDGTAAMSAPMAGSSAPPSNASPSSNPSQAPLTGDAFSTPSQSNNSGNTYNDPQGRFTVAIPQGWTPAPQGDSGATGVMISQGTSYAVLAPWGNANQPGDIVMNLAGQFQSKYQNFVMGQRGPSKLNGMDIAFGKFTATNANGVPVAMVIIGIAGPGGHYYMLLSSVSQSDEQATGAALNTILQSIRFAGQ